MDRRVREDRQATGATSLYDRAVLEARRILESHRPAPLPADVQAEMAAIVAKAERDLGVGRGPGRDRDN
jgi:trimethylamine:corrinoid methyltransferase-like protein